MADFTFGIIGTGAEAEAHASAILRCRGVSLGAVRGRKIRDAEEFASRHGSAAAYEEVEYLLENRDIDGIAAACPLSERAECIRLGLSSGRPVIAECPVAETSEEAAALIRLSEAEGALLTPFAVRRCCSGIRYLKDSIGSGRFGRILKVSVSCYSDKSASSYEASPEDPGLLCSEGYEALDVLLSLIGKPRLISAFSGNIAGRSDKEDIYSVSFIAGNAVHGELSLIASAYAHDSFCVSVIGSSGYGEYSDGRLECCFSDGRYSSSDEASGIDAFYGDYVSSLFSGREALSKAEDALLAIRVIEAVKRAARRTDYQ